MKTKTIKQKVEFNAQPHDIYEMLMDSEKHSEFTGAEASISRKVGGKITAYDGYIEGVNLILEADKRIVQSWRASDWPEGHYSKATFELKKTKKGTELAFTQEGVPEEQYKELSEGWHEHYWEKIKRIIQNG